MTQALFDNTLSPTTSIFGFLELQCEVAANAFVEWQTEILQPLGDCVHLQLVKGDFKSVLARLLPLSKARSRYLFCPTRSIWTVFFDNFWLGTDAAAPIRYLSKRCSCRGIRAVAVPHTIADRTVDGRYGATILEVYQNGGVVRTIFAANDGGKWKFGQSGEPFLFEEVDRYNTTPIKGRFTIDMIERYLKHFDIYIFDESFFMPPHNEKACFIQRTAKAAE